VKDERRPLHSRLDALPHGRDGRAQRRAAGAVGIAGDAGLVARAAMICSMGFSGSFWKNPWGHSRASARPSALGDGSGRPRSCSSAGSSAIGRGSCHLVAGIGSSCRSHCGIGLLAFAAAVTALMVLAEH
jgi:hypothetical protein